MLRAKNYKNKTVATPHGNVEFNHEGNAKSNKDSELLLSKFPEFEYVEEKVEKKNETEIAEKKEEPVKKAPVKRAPRKKASDKKEEEK